MASSPDAPTPRKKRSLLREIARRLVVLGILGLAWLLWSPGDEIRDGRHDRRENGLWLAHGWMGGDEWFTRYGKEDEKPRYRSDEALRSLAARLKQHGISDVFPHLCPAEPGGKLPAVDAVATERFLDALPGVRVWPWVGGTLADVDIYEESWRKTYAANIRALLEAHPRLAGVQLNIEPLKDGTVPYLTLLDEIRAALPDGRKLSIAAYPPPTRWQPTKEVHWDEAYFREVAKRSDHLAVMTYDTSIRFQKAYRKLMKDWTREVLEWSEGKPVLIGIPAYEDADTTYHKPDVENIPNALAGMHAALLTYDQLPQNYRGIAIYCDWEMNDAKWADITELFGAR
jgi:hypothetical protein